MSSILLGILNSAAAGGVPGFIWEQRLEQSISYGGKRKVWHSGNAEWVTNQGNRTISGDNYYQGFIRVNPETGYVNTNSYAFGQNSSPLDGADLYINSNNYISAAGQMGHGPSGTMADSSYTKQWSVSNGTGYSGFWSTALDNSNNAFFCGQMDSSPLYAYQGKGIVIKVTAAGSVAWAKQVGTTSVSWNSAVCDSSGNLYIAGRESGIAGITVAKLDTNGNLQWAKTFTSWYQYGQGITITDQGNILLVGLEDVSGVYKPAWAQLDPSNGSTNFVHYLNVTGVPSFNRAHASITPSIYGGNWVVWHITANRTWSAHIKDDGTIDRMVGFSGFNHWVEGIGSSPIDDALFMGQRGNDGSPNTDQAWWNISYQPWSDAIFGTWSGNVIFFDAIGYYSTVTNGTAPTDNGSMSVISSSYTFSMTGPNYFAYNPSFTVNTLV